MSDKELLDDLEDLVDWNQRMAEKTGPEEFEIAYSNAAEQLQEVINDYQGEQE